MLSQIPYGRNTCEGKKPFGYKIYIFGNLQFYQILCVKRPSRKKHTKHQKGIIKSNDMSLEKVS